MKTCTGLCYELETVCETLNGPSMLFLHISMNVNL